MNLENTYTRQVWKWTGSGWVTLFVENVTTVAKPVGFPLAIPSDKGPTAGTTIGGHGTPYLYEIWWERLPATWGGSDSWAKRAEGGNW
jgi:hypothetical protein